MSGVLGGFLDARPVARLTDAARGAGRRRLWGTGLVAGAAACLVLISIARAVTGGGATALVVPLLLALGQLAAAAALLLGRPGARLAAGALLFLTGLLHVVIALGDGAWWFRLLSVMLLAATVAAGILISPIPVDDDPHGGLRPSDRTNGEAT